jgi:hypothetical protein
VHAKPRTFLPWPRPMRHSDNFSRCGEYSTLRCDLEQSDSEHYSSTIDAIELVDLIILKLLANYISQYDVGYTRSSIKVLSTSKNLCRRLQVLQCSSLEPESNANILHFVAIAFIVTELCCLPVIFCVFCPSVNVAKCAIFVLLCTTRHLFKVTIVV